MKHDPPSTGEPDDETFVVHVPPNAGDRLEGVVWHAESGRWRPFRGLDALRAAIAATLADGGEAR